MTSGCRPRRPDHAIRGARAMIADKMRSSLADCEAQALRASLDKLSVSEMRATTFTVSNLGGTRVRYFTPTVNPLQIAILGAGALLVQAWVAPDGGVALRPTRGLSPTFDRRAVDGAPAAAFLTALREAIEAA